MTFKRL